MRTGHVVVISACVVLGLPSVSFAQSSWGNVLKSAAQAAGQAAGQAAVGQMSPQAQTAIAEANKLKAGAPQENFLVTKAKEFMTAKNYQPALDLANYVLTTLNSGSVDAKKIMTDAQAALTKAAQDKLAGTAAGKTVQQGQAQATAAKQAQTDVTQAATTLKNLFGTK